MYFIVREAAGGIDTCGRKETGVGLGQVGVCTVGLLLFLCRKASEFVFTVSFFCPLRREEVVSDAFGERRVEPVEFASPDELPLVVVSLPSEARPFPSCWSKGGFFGSTGDLCRLGAPSAGTMFPSGP